MADIQIATKLLGEKSDTDNLIDANYKKLNCDIEPLDKNSKEYKIIEEYT